MDHGNWWLTETLDRMRREEIRHELAHEQLLHEHGLDLWSVFRGAIAGRLPRRLARAEPAAACAEQNVKTRIAA